MNDGGATAAGGGGGGAFAMAGISSSTGAPAKVEEPVAEKV
jgi:hypothetical protein